MATDVKTDKGVPRNAAALIDKAKANGWTVRITTSGGVLTNRNGSKVVESLAVRLRRGSERAFGVWIDGKFDNGQSSQVLHTGRVAFPPRKQTLSGLGTLVTAQDG
jgi:hypothetical protein